MLSNVLTVSGWHNGGNDGAFSDMASSETNNVMWSPFCGNYNIALKESELMFICQF